MGAAKTGSRDNNVSVILFGNNWIQSNLILIQMEALTGSDYVNLNHPDKDGVHPCVIMRKSPRGYRGLVLFVCARESKKTPPAELMFWPVAMPRSKERWEHAYERMLSTDK